MEAVIEQEFEAQSYDPASILRGKSVASRLMRVVTGACATRRDALLPSLDRDLSP